MNPSFWGGNAWDVLHELPWFYKNEILSDKESVEVVSFIHSFMHILSCSACSSSALQFERKSDLIKSISIVIDGHLIVTRARIASYIYNLRNEVNEKLGKPNFGTSWIDSLKCRSNWKESLLTFLFSVAWNYQKSTMEDKDTFYELFFTILLPRVLAKTDIGESYNIYQQAYCFRNVLGDRDNMVAWTYGLRKQLSELLKHEPWPIVDIILFLHSVEARKSCGSDSLGCE